MRKWKGKTANQDLPCFRCPMDFFIRSHDQKISKNAMVIAMRAGISLVFLSQLEIFSCIMTFWSGCTVQATLLSYYLHSADYGWPTTIHVTHLSFKFLASFASFLKKYFIPLTNASSGSLLWNGVQFVLEWEKGRKHVVSVSFCSAWRRQQVRYWSWYSLCFKYQYWSRTREERTSSHSTRDGGSRTIITSSQS